MSEVPIFNPIPIFVPPTTTSDFTTTITKTPNTTISNTNSSVKPSISKGKSARAVKENRRLTRVTKTKKEKQLEKIALTAEQRKIRNKKLKPIIITITIVLILIIIFITIAYRIIRENLAQGGGKINSFLLKRCKSTPVLDVKDFPWTKNFRDNYKDILKEFNGYRKKNIIPAYRDINKDSAGDTEGWKALFLRVFNNDTDMIKDFPKTKALLAKCPCTTAYFSMLEPGTHIKPHKGIYAGVLRYHLSLVSPKKWEDCFIIVDGQKLHWKEPGHELMFDDMYTHEVQNNTNERRVVLFLDVRRNFNSGPLNLLNRIILKFASTNDTLVATVDKANRISNPEKYKKEDLEKKKREEKEEAEEIGGEREADDKKSTKKNDSKKNDTKKTPRKETSKKETPKKDTGGGINLASLFS